MQGQRDRLVVQCSRRERQLRSRKEFLETSLTTYVGDAGAFAKPSEMELLHFSAARTLLPDSRRFRATDKAIGSSEGDETRLRPLPLVVKGFPLHYQGWMQRRSKGANLRGWKNILAQKPYKAASDFSLRFI